jgi:hypothetical protein
MNSDSYIKVGVDEEEANHVFDPNLQGDITAEEVIQEIMAVEGRVGEGRLEKILISNGDELAIRVLSKKPLAPGLYKLRGTVLKKTKAVLNTASHLPTTAAARTELNHVYGSRSAPNIANNGLISKHCTLLFHYLICIITIGQQSNRNNIGYEVQFSSPKTGLLTATSTSSAASNYNGPTTTDSSNSSKKRRKTSNHNDDTAATVVKERTVRETIKLRCWKLQQNEDFIPFDVLAGDSKYIYFLQFFFFSLLFFLDIFLCNFVNRKKREYSVERFYENEAESK